VRAAPVLGMSDRLLGTFRKSVGVASIVEYLLRMLNGKNLKQRRIAAKDCSES
jgi:hypothetical protein